MTQEEKSLLLQDLCARLPYMPKIKIIYQQQGIEGTDEGNVSCDFIEKIVNDLRNGIITDMQIYLRPMSSMTEIEYNFVYNGHIQFWDREDYCNKHHLDYRGLISKGLALEALEGMYK